MGHGIPLTRALVPTTKSQSFIASFRDVNSLLLASRSSAPAARALASADGKLDGLTKRKFCCPIVFMARAAAPILPGCVVPTKTIQTFSKKFFIMLPLHSLMPTT